MTLTKNYKSINFPPLNESQLKELETLKLIDDNSINTEDIPEATSKELSFGHFYYTNPLKSPKL